MGEMNVFCVAHPPRLSPPFITFEFFENSVNYRILVVMPMVVPIDMENSVRISKSWQEDIAFVEEGPVNWPNSRCNRWTLRMGELTFFIVYASLQSYTLITSKTLHIFLLSQQCNIIRNRAGRWRGQSWGW